MVTGSDLDLFAKRGNLVGHIRYLVLVASCGFEFGGNIMKEFCVFDGPGVENTHF